MEVLLFGGWAIFQHKMNSNYRLDHQLNSWKLPSFNFPNMNEEGDVQDFNLDGEMKFIINTAV